MCGIAGIVRISPAGQPPPGIPDDWIRTLDEHIAWRGPDDAGVFRDLATAADGQVVEVALIHRRLSIIDPVAGAQPMVIHHENDPADRLAVVFNGCIYNHRELRDDLEARGHRFASSHSDTETIPVLYRHRRSLAWARRDGTGPATVSGDDPLRRLPVAMDAFEGMFAYAVWDRAMARVVIARDRHGEKPLWLTRRRGGVVVFASTIAALAALHDLLGWDDAEEPAPPTRSPAAGRTGDRPSPAGSPRLDPVSSVDWFALGWSSEHAPHRAIAAVPIGRELVIEPTEAVPPTPLKSLALALLVLPIAVPALIVAATLLVLVSAVLWLGTALPYIALLLLPLPAGLVLRAFGRPSPRRLVQRELDLVDKAERRIDDAVRAMLEADVPIGLFLSGGVDSSLVARAACAQAGPLPAFCVRMPDEAYDESSYAAIAARHAGAALHLIDPPGDVLGDIERLIALIGAPFADSSLLPAWWLCRGAGEHIRVALSGDGGDELFLGYERQRVAPILHWASLPIAALPARAFDRSDPRSRSAKVARLIDAARGAGYVDLLAIFPSRLRRRLIRGPWRGALASGLDADAALTFDRRHYLPGDLMLKTDTAGMAANIEVRAPLLHPAVADFAAGLRPRDAMLANQRKGLLRALARRYFPAELIDRPKMGFALPIGRWFRADHAGLRTALMDALSSIDPFGEVGQTIALDIPRIRSLVEEHQSGAADHGQRLYALLVLAIWSRIDARHEFRPSVRPDIPR